MSTRCMIEIDGIDAKLYRHCDGYPGDLEKEECGVLMDIVPFVKDFLKNRGWDTEYLAARLISHLIVDSDTSSSKWRKTWDKNWSPDEKEYTGFGICNNYHSDIEYLYKVFKDRIEVYDTNAFNDEDQELIQTVPLVEEE